MGKKLSLEELNAIVGNRYGYLTIKEYIGKIFNNRKVKNHYYQCQCACNKTLLVMRNDLLNNHTKSC